MSDKQSDRVYQVIVRLPEDTANRLLTLTEKYMRRSVLTGIKVGRATVAREAIILGLPLLEKRFW